MRDVYALYEHSFRFGTDVANKKQSIAILERRWEILNVYMFHSQVENLYCSVDIPSFVISSMYSISSFIRFRCDFYT